MNKKIFKNYLYNMLYQVTTMIIPLITTPFISKVLKVDEIGIYNFTYTICLYFCYIASMGFPIYGQKKIAVIESKTERERIFTEIFLSRVATGAVALSIYCFITLVYFQYKIIYLIQGICLLATLFDISWYYAGREDFKTITIRNLVVKIVSTILLFLCVKDPNALIKYSLIVAIPNLVGNLSMFYKLDVKVKLHKIQIGQIKDIILDSVILLVPSLVLQVANLIDKTILGMFSNMTELGYYSQTFKIVNILVLVTSALGTVLLPVLTKIIEVGNKDELSLCIKDAVSLIIHVSMPMIAGLAAITDIFVIWFFGYDYEKLNILLPCALPLTLIMALGNLFGNQFLIAANKTKYLICNISFGALLNIGFDTILVGKYGALGAIAASLLSEFVVMLANIISFIKFENIGILKGDFWKPIIASLTMGVILNIIKHHITLSALSATAILVLLGGFIYIFILAVFRDDFLLGYIMKKKSIKENDKI